MRDTAFQLGVSRQLPLVFMMKVLLTEGRALASEGVVTGTEEEKLSSGSLLMIGTLISNLEGLHPAEIYILTLGRPRVVEHAAGCLSFPTSQETVS